jgi:hypothetical protein
MSATGPQVRGSTPLRRVLLPPNLSRADVRLRVTCPDRSWYGHPDPSVRCRREPMHPPGLVHGARAPERSADSPVASLRVERPSVPPGYRIGWTDGRLNPYRGIRTETGEADMRKIWTDTVPRRLVVVAD